MVFVHLIFLTQNLESLSSLLGILGFRSYSAKKREGSLLFQQNHISIEGRLPSSSHEKESLNKKQGTTIAEFWISTPQEKSLVFDKLGTTIQCLPPNKISEYFESRFYINQDRTDQSHHNFQPILSHIDHVALNIKEEHFSVTSESLRKKLGFVPLAPQKISGHTTSFTCSAFQLPGASFFLVLNTSCDPGSQINDFLNRHNGPGVQHIAFHSENLEASIPYLKQNSIPFIDIPEDYYNTLYKKELTSQEINSLKKAHLLYEPSLNHEGFLKQTFTKNLFGPLFFEIIHRHNLSGFGENNITNLFKALE
tara:strand:+ start:948 stop:1874 length:927 start_codon:yes stop_codon:yes gene_type:complete